MTEIWQIVGIAIGSIALLAAVGAHYARPWLRSWRLRAPCEVHFTIVPLQQLRLDYVLQDDLGHHVKELVLPPKREIEIEIEYVPKLAFQGKEISFGCDGEDADKPRATEIIRRVIAVGKNRWVPGEDEGCWRDRHGYIHFISNRQRQKGSRIPVGFKIQTGRAGVYPANIFFFTEEKPGQATLIFRVEDKPRTLMRCIEHQGCVIRPMVPQD